MAGLPAFVSEAGVRGLRDYEGLLSYVNADGIPLECKVHVLVFSNLIDLAPPPPVETGADITDVDRGVYDGLGLDDWQAFPAHRSDPNRRYF